MKPETFQRAVELDGRVRNVAAAYGRIFNASTVTPASYKIELTGLPDADRDAITKLVLDYLDREERQARAEFDALRD